MRTFTITLLLALGVANAAAHAEEYTKSYSVVGHPEVRVRVDDSSVRVVTSDTHQVDFDVKQEGSATVRFGGEIKVDSRQDGNVVELTVLRKAGITIGFSNTHISTEVRMPKDADLQIETRDGRVDLSDVNGNVTIHTTDGAVKVARLAGKIDIRSVDGSISAAALTGDSKLHSTDGSISVDRVDGQCDASTTDGSVRVAGRFDFLNAESTDGSIKARVEPGSKMTSAWNIKTGDGSIELAVPGEFKANLDAKTRDGHISLGVPVTVQGNISKTEVHGTLNGGGPELTVRSGDGSIRISGI
jgi:DUF4097 and DUF4098 domain-containing protein YvlB